MSKVMKMFLPIIISIFLPLTASAKENDTIISEEAQEACIKYGDEYNICPEFLMAIIERESCGDPNATGGSCKGLMQISDKWHKDRMKKLGVTDIYDTRGNIHVGADYIAELFEKYGEAATVLAVYHGESGGVAKTEQGYVSGYSGWILERSAELEEIHGK